MITVKRIAFASLLCLLLATVQANAQSIQQNEKTALDVIKSLHSAAKSYSEKYKEIGLPPNMVSLGPPPEGLSRSPAYAYYVQSWLACKETPCKGTAYSFLYEKQGLNKYRIVARPLKYGESGKRSFYSDQTGRVHATSEDREATAEDPVVTE